VVEIIQKHGNVAEVRYTRIAVETSPTTKSIFLRKTIWVTRARRIVQTRHYLHEELYSYEIYGLLGCQLDMKIQPVSSVLASARAARTQTHTKHTKIHSTRQLHWTRRICLQNRKNHHPSKRTHRIRIRIRLRDGRCETFQETKMKKYADTGKAPPIGLEPMTDWLTASRST
jgi:hypothetical protein